jgi:capsular exopolysaccharide synthesis family protein
MKEIPRKSPRPIMILEDEDAVHDARRREPVVGDAPSIRDYWRVFRKHQRLILICLGTAIAVSTIVAFSTTPTYVAQATLMIERKAPRVVKIQQVIGEAEQADESSFYESQYQLLKSRSLAAEVIKAQKLDSDATFINQFGRTFSIGQLLSIPVAWVKSPVPQAPLVNTPSTLGGVSSKLIDTYTGMLDIEPIKRSRIVTIGISSPNPELAARIANAHVDGYIQQGFKLKNQANEEARKFLQTKLGELKERVENSEMTLNQFRRDEGIISLDDKENIVVERLADLNKRLTESEAERIGLEAQARLIKNRQYDSLPAVLSNSLIQNLKNQVVQLEAERAKLAERFLPGYPRLAQLNAQLTEAKARLTEQIKNVVAGINSAYLAAAGKERELRGQMEKQKTETFALKDASVQYAILAREADTNKQLYDSVLERYREISVAGELPTSNITIVDRAEIPQLPVKPNKRLNLMLGMFLGLFGGLGLALLMEHLNNTVSTPEEAEQLFGVPCLSVVPDVFTLPRRPANAHSSVVRRLVQGDAKLCLPSRNFAPNDRRLLVISEVYHKLRMSILLARADRPPKTVLFTSSTAGEGKTITTTNTAIMFARMGSRVLVLDADLRQPSCLRALRVQSAWGLSDYLVGLTGLDKVISSTPIPNLSVLGAGSVPPSPTELIGSKKMADTLELLKQQYDFIFIDSPPVMPVSDSVVLSTMVDGLVFVVRGQNTPKPIVKDALAQLSHKSSKILGMVLNRVDMKSPDYQHYYHYYDSGDYFPAAKLV